jgi:hypothetical protein
MEKNKNQEIKEWEEVEVVVYHQAKWNVLGFEV